MTLDELVFELREMSLADLESLSAAALVPFGTVIKIRYGVTKRPRESTFYALLDAFERRQW